MSNIKFETCIEKREHNNVSCATNMLIFEKAYWKGQLMYIVCVDPVEKNRFHIYGVQSFWLHGTFIHDERPTPASARERIEVMALEFEAWVRARAFLKKIKE